MDASRSTRRAPFERLAMLGALVCVGSLALPWYQIPSADRFQKSGLGSFDFAEAALLVTIFSALALIYLVHHGRRPPLPMHEGTLLAVAGGWSAVIVAFLMVDRPEETVFDFPTAYGLRYGIFVALAGAVTLAAGGIGVRRLELSREAEGVPGPASASPPRSPR